MASSLHACPTCSTGRAFTYTCRQCKASFDNEFGVGQWETSDWFRALASMNNRMERVECVEARLIALLNTGALAGLEAQVSLYDRTAALIHAGVVDAELLLKQLTGSRQRVNQQYYRQVIARALADLAHIVSHTEEEEWGLAA